MSDATPEDARRACTHESANLCMCDDPECGLWTCPDCGDSGLKQRERKRKADANAP